MGKNFKIKIMYVIPILLFNSCKTFELKEEARNIIFTKDSRIETSSLCDQIKLIAADEKAKNEEEKINDLKNEAASLGANLILSDFFELQSYNSDGKLKTYPAFGIYKCTDPGNVSATLDAKENEVLIEEKRMEELRLDNNPHYWVICDTMKSKVYDTKKECENRAWLMNQIGRELGYQCSCEYTILKNKK